MTTQAIVHTCQRLAAPINDIKNPKAQLALSIAPFLLSMVLANIANYKPAQIDEKLKEAGLSRVQITQLIRSQRKALLVSAFVQVALSVATIAAAHFAPIFGRYLRLYSAWTLFQVGVSLFWIWDNNQSFSSRPLP